VYLSFHSKTGSLTDLGVWRPCPINVSLPSPPLDNIRVMVIAWRLRGNIIRTAPCWVVWHNVHSQQHTHASSSYRCRLGLSHWDPYAMHRGGCLKLYYCNMVEWCWLDSSFIWKTNWCQCFDTVGLVIWPVKIVSDMTYNVFGGTLNLAQSINHFIHELFNSCATEVAGLILECMSVMAIGSRHTCQPVSCAVTILMLSARSWLTTVCRVITFVRAKQYQFILRFKIIRG